MGLSLVTVNKPILGVTSSDIPQELSDFLAVEVPKVLAAPGDKELILAHDTAALAQKFALYARAWGMRDDGAAGQAEIRATDQDGNEIKDEAGNPVIVRQAIGYQVEIRRIANRRDMPDTQVRLTVKPYDPNSVRPGRPAGSVNAAAEASQEPGSVDSPENAPAVRADEAKASGKK